MAEWVREEQAPTWSCPRAVRVTNHRACNASQLGWHAKLTTQRGKELQSDILRTSPLLDGMILLMLGDSLARDQYTDAVCSLHRRPDTSVAPLHTNSGGAMRISETRGPNASFWFAYSHYGSLDTKTCGSGAESKQRDCQPHREAIYERLGPGPHLEDARRVLAKIRARISASESPYRGKAPRGLIVHLGSLKPHGHRTHGDGGPSDSGASAYFSALASFVPALRSELGRGLFYYRPAFATHFNTRTADYDPFTGRKKPCREIDSAPSATQHGRWFLREERSLLDAGPEVVTIPHVWDLSVGVPSLHPGVSRAVGHNGTVVDCLHFCIHGDGHSGVYEAINRWWWWDMLRRLSQPGTAAGSSRALDGRAQAPGA
jgi:hypothetical protein